MTTNAVVTAIDIGSEESLLCHRRHRMVHEGGFIILQTDAGEIVTLAPLMKLPAHAREPASLDAA